MSEPVSRKSSKTKQSPAKKRPASAGPTASAGAAISKIAPARLAAFEILTSVGEGKGHSDELLHSARMEALSPEDRHLTTALVMGVLRWQIALDARIRSLLQRPEQRLAEPVALALRMGAFQLLHLDRIPAHAALSESVELCRAAGQPHATGMVNAVLRKLAVAQKPGQRVFESVAAFSERLGRHMPELGGQLLEVVSFSLMFVVSTLVFAFIFKFLPHVKIAWRDVIPGAVFTTVLFVLGELIIGFYFHSTEPASAFGAAAGLISLLIWTFYSSQTFFLGAEFVYVWCEVKGRPIQPTADAVKVIHQVVKLEEGKKPVVIE